MREEKSKSGKVQMRNKALFIGIIGIVAIALAVAAIGANANISTEASDKVNAPDVPHKINYQGYLTDAAGNPITGNRDMTFKIYDSPTGGTPLWSETQTSVRVENGLFNVILGCVNSIPGDVFPSGGSRWLGTEIEDQPLTPRKEIVSVAYAFKADPDDDWDYTTNPSHMYSIPPGNVGIGTESPQAKLDVITTDATTGLKVKISGSGPKSGWAAYFENAATGELPGCGVKAVGHPGVYGETDVTGYTGVAGVYGVTHDATNYGVHGENTVGGFAGYFDGKGYFSDDVGIGTTAPSEKLDVEGNIHASGSIKSGNTLIIDGPNDRILTTSGEMYFGRGPTGNFKDVKVGIGTTLPRKKLEVYNQGSAAIRLHGEARHSTDVDLIAVPANVLPDGFDKFLINVDDITRFVIHSNGNVGIGETYPSEKLHVNGNIKATGSIKSGDGIRIDGVNNRIEAFSLPDNNLRIIADKVGIGTTDPHSTLHIDGSVATAFTPVGPSIVPYVLTASDCIIAVDAPLVIQLPTAVGIAGRVYTIKRIDAGSFFVAIKAAAGETIDGRVEYILGDQWKYVTIVSDGANWLIIAE